MSRFENKPITVPEDVTLQLQERRLMANGKLGETVFVIPKGVTVNLADKVIRYSAVVADDMAKVGLCYRMTLNLLTGVQVGFKKELEVKGVGYRWSSDGKRLKLQLGFSNDIFCDIPAELEVAIKGASLIVSGIDKQVVGAFAAKIKQYRSVEPYKGKGIRYKGEVVIRKVGKAGKTTG